MTSSLKMGTLTTRLKQSNSTNKQHICLSYITHSYCDQNNIDSVINLLQIYEGYSAELLSKVQFVIVDDGSSVKYSIRDFKLNIIWLKIRNNVVWNQAGARNLRVTYAKSDKIVVTDLDQILSEETLERLVKRRNPGRNFYKMFRKDQEGKVYKGHCNLFFMSRARYLRFYGYDEEFVGNYGYEEVRFVKFQKYHGSRQKYLSQKFTCFERNLDRKNSYHSLQRTLERNAEINLRKKKETELYGYEYGHSRCFLNFEWDKIAEFQLLPPTPDRKRLWKHLWWFRWLIPAFAN